MSTFSSSLSEIRAGSVLAFYKQGLLGELNTLAQGNTDVAHVAIVLPNGKLATTGAKWGLFYGETDLESYCKGKTFDVLYPYDGFTPEQLTILVNCHSQMMKSFWKRLYGGIRYPQLYAAALAGTGQITEADANPPKPPKWFICSWAVGYCLWEMGCKVGKMFGKLNYTGLIPEDFGKEADATTELLELDGAVVVKHPCLYLRRVAHYP